MTLRLIFRILAVAVVPFSLAQTVAPIGEFMEWLRVAIDPNISFVNPTGFEHFAQASTHLLQAIVMLGVGPLFWLAGDIAFRVQGAGRPTAG